jgi:hypothetical protein
MKTISFSVDMAEWTRYLYSVEVEDDLSPSEMKEAARAALENCECKEHGTKCLGNVEMVDPVYHWPEELSK